MTQSQGKTVLQVVTRLRAAAKDGGYGENTENQKRDEVLRKCLANLLVSAVRAPLHYLTGSWYLLHTTSSPLLRIQELCLVSLANLDNWL